MHESSQLLITADGSHTVTSARYDAAYHSIHGSIKESEVVFIKSGLDYCAGIQNTAMNIFEMGFGTGLNALLTLLWAEEQNVPVYYVSVELHPLDASTVQSLNYGQLLNASHTFDQIHNAAWNKDVEINPYFKLHKWQGDVADFKTDSLFNLVYYDAFAPGAQPELWSEEAFSRMYDLLVQGGALVSYCAQGAFKRNLRSAGFEVETLPGPPGKREMTRGIKNKSPK